MARQPKKIEARWAEASAELLSAASSLKASERALEQDAAEEEGVSDFDIAIPNDIQNVGTETTTAPTTNPSRPRALTIAYNPNTRTLLVVFRDNTWWQYNNVPVDMWLGLKSSPSTGRYLRESGLDAWDDMGPASLRDISAATLAQVSYSAETAGRIQKGMSI